MSSSNRQAVRFFDLSGLPHVQAVSGTNVTSEFRRHAHEGFCIGVVKKGSRIMYKGGASTVIHENEMFVINPEAVHACKSRDKGHSYMIVCVQEAGMQSLASQISAKTQAMPYFKNTLIHDAELGSIISRFFSLIENTGSILEVETVVLSLLSMLILRHADTAPTVCCVGAHDNAIKRVREFMRMSYARRLSLKQLSGVARLSPFYFQRLFRENTGISPHDFLLQVRIRKARQLLSEGQGIAHVGHHTGFVDQSHFTRSFKRVTGVTPGQYVSVTQTGFR
jgi:AraC-like DNA-binding protein